MSSSTGDNDPSQLLQDGPTVCDLCQGKGYFDMAPPHPGCTPGFLHTMPRHAGTCGKCMGLGEPGVAILPTRASEFVFLEFMPDNWGQMGVAQAQAQIAHLQSQVAKHHTPATNKPSLAGLREVYQGMGMTPEQAEMASRAAFGYIRLT